MSWTMKEFSLNSCVPVRITRWIAAGLLGVVDGGQRAIIRNREIAWEDPGPLDQYVGQTRDALVLGLNPAYNQLELSLRLVERDPWPEAVQRYAEGTQVVGRVVGLIEAGAFVEVEPGVEGFLPASDLAGHVAGRIGDWLWIGDQVRAIVTRVQAGRRQLRLSLGDLLAQREAQFRRRIWHGAQAATASHIAVARSVPVDVWLRLMQLGADAEATGSEYTPHVLLIEDDPVYAAGLESFFRWNGCQVMQAGDGPAGMDQVGSQAVPFDLIVLDWNLPGPKGHEVVEELRAQDCPSRLAMMLEWTPLQSQPETWEALRESGIDVFFKADGDRCMEGLVSILRDLREDRTRSQGSHQRHFPTATLPASLQVSPLPSPAPGAVSGATTDGVPSPPLQTGLAGILAQLRDDTGAEVVLLLCLEPERANLQVDGCAGNCDAFQQMPPDLIHSALADVLVRCRVVDERVSPEAPRFRRLLALLPFNEFLGLPVLSVRAVRYGLILLRAQGAFSRNQKQKAQLAAYLIAGVLQQQHFTDSLEPWQSQNLLGQVASSVVHEVTNKLGGLELQIKALQEGLRQLAHYPPAGGDPSFVHGMEQAVEGLAEAHRQASDLRNRYLGLVASEGTRWVDVNTLAEETIQMLKPEAQQCNVILELEAAAGLPRVWVRPGQLRQILLNLGLNAIQQMAAIGRHGIVRVATGHLPGVPRPVQVRFTDDGPGVHASLRERIFEFGFTTKNDGAGLGLTICRQVAAKLGGTVQVEESHMLWGTTFLLELPGGGGDG